MGLANLTQTDILNELAPLAYTYLEVGVQEGKSLATVLRANPDIRHILLCDTWGGESGGSNRGSHDHIAKLLLESNYRDQVTFLDGDSQVTLERYSHTSPSVFDLVHIDGGHSYDNTLNDLTNGWRLCSSHLVLHDISFPEVFRALWDFISSRDDLWSVTLYTGGHGTAVIVRQQ